MLKNYLKTAWRSLTKNKVHTFINIAGMSVGLASSLLILLWVQNELNVDAFHENASRLFSVYERQYLDHKIEGQYATPGTLADEMKRVIPEVQYATGMTNNYENTFQVGNRIMKEEGASAGADFFKMFSYQLLQGSPQTALSTPAGITISRKMAEEFFGSPQAAIGKTIRFENRLYFTITGVFENLPKSSFRKFDYLIGWDAFSKEMRWLKLWSVSRPLTYVMLRADADPALVEKKVTHFLDAYIKPTAAFRIELGLQKFGDTYLHNQFNNGKIDGGRIEYIHLFSIAAILILLIACINFMNLTTARSIKRAKEIGVRKVIGAVRSILIWQFIGEAVLFTFIAAIISLLLVGLLLPVFNLVTQKQISLPFDQPIFWLIFVGLISITGFISGSYPALFLSSFKPVKVLKGSLNFSIGASRFRKGLVVFQFTISIALIVSTIVISKQVKYIQTKNLGYDRENFIYIPLEGDLGANYHVFKDEALKMPGINLVTRITNTPTYFDAWSGAVSWSGKDPNVDVQFAPIAVGYDFVRTMKLKMYLGRDFSRDFAADSLGYLINETALKRIGYTDPIGKTLTLWGKSGKIIGVVKDFHFNSLHDPIKPLIVSLVENSQYGNILVRTQPGQTKQALATLEILCKGLNPNFTFTYAFSDEEYQKLYKGEQIVGKLFNSFAFLAIIISCLGLLGLAMFTAEQRVKEIGIRKVLGASVGSLFALLSKEFLILVLIALFVGSPIAWFVMSGWLRGYTYRIDIEWWVFALSGMISLVIAFLTISFQSIKASLINPIKSLRSE